MLAAPNLGLITSSYPPPPPLTTFSKTVFLLVPDSVKRKLVSDSPELVDLDRASEFSS